jgi:4-amino-4-deoxy-L-arabinose transferase-like glycosyltransferase
MRRSPTTNITTIAAVALMVACAAIAGMICLGRQYFNVDTETDFLGSFMLDAERVARGQPLLLLNHPPGYAAVLALVQGGLDDWLKSGLLISWVSLIVVLLASYDLFHRVGGGWVALGGLVGLAVSDVFLAYGAQATSDVPFLALWMTALALTAAALDGRTRWRWVAVGAVAGFGVLTRSTGMPLLLLALAPLLAGREWRSRVADSVAAAAGLAAPICAWLGFAAITGSPITPTENYASLALAYREGRLTSDTLLVMRDRFTSTWQVITHDPPRLITTYFMNLVRLPRPIVMQTTWPLVAMLGLAALPFWVLTVRNPKMLIVSTTTLVAVLLTNLHPEFEARYYLFLVPLLGASAGYALSFWVDRSPRPRLASAIAIVGLAVAAGAGLLHAAPRASMKAEAPGVRAQLAEAVPAVRRSTAADATLVTYKDNLPFHAERRLAMLPPVTTIDKLCAPVQDQLKGGPVYVYIGYAERRRARVELSRQLLGSDLPPWLTVVAEGRAGGGWRLLGVKPTICGDGRT